MRIKTASPFIAGFILWTIPGLLGPSLFAQSVVAESPSTWNLPQGRSLKDDGPRTYRFTVDYNTANTKGEMMVRQRLTGEYTRGLAGGEVMWKNVTQADAAGATAPFGTAAKTRLHGGVPLSE